MNAIVIKRAMNLHADKKFPVNSSVKNVWDNLRTSYWFVPTLMALAVVVLWVVVFQVDLRMKDRLGGITWLYTGGPEGARSILSALIGAMITVAGVVFSITVLVLTLASQQFGPLLLRNFLRDKGSQLVLGTFVSTFIFCLLVLRTVHGPDAKEFVPQVSVTTGVVLGMISIGVLVYYIHHISVFIQAPYLISVVYGEVDQAIDRIFPEKLGKAATSRAHENRDRETESAFDSGAGIVKASDRGYVKAVDSNTLLESAVEHDLVLRPIKYPGEYVIPGGDLIAVLPKEALNEDLAAEINNAYILGARRTSIQDLDFLFSQLVEIAVRALSPGINDPFTAVICIDHLCAALCKLAGRALPSPYRHDADGKLRVIAYPATFVRMTDVAFNQIRLYGKTHPSVLARLLYSVSVTSPFVSRDEDRQALIRHAEMIKRTAAASLLSEDDRGEVARKYDQAMKNLTAV